MHKQTKDYLRQSHMSKNVFLTILRNEIEVDMKVAMICKFEM